MREHEGLEVVWLQRELVHEHRDIGENQGGVHDGIGAVGVQVFERDEHAPTLVQSSGRGENWKQAFPVRPIMFASGRWRLTESGAIEILWFCREILRFHKD